MADNLKIVESNLANRPYMTGNTFTMGDIPMGVALHRWFLLPIERPASPRLASYYDRLKQRPGFQTHCAAPLS
jgi:glutathione S-transferase